MRNQDSEVIEASVDYVTISGKSEQIYGLQSSLQVLLDHYHEEGHKAKQVSNHGYSGWQLGPVKFLDNGEYGYVQASGDPAGFVASVAGGYDLRCTRIDFQVTIKHEPENGQTIGEIVYSDALKHPTCPSPTRILSPAGGDTVYIGSRISDRFARVYRKDSEDRDGGWPRHTWRYELELKKPRSQKAWRSMLDIPSNERAKHIIALIGNYCGMRGIFFPVTSDMASGINDTLRRKKTPLERKLTWIRDGVSPTILELFDAGLAKDVLEALGARSSGVIAEHILEALRQLGHKP